MNIPQSDALPIGGRHVADRLVDQLPPSLTVLTLHPLEVALRLIEPRNTLDARRQNGRFGI